MNFDQYKFRCSGLGNLLVDPRTKTAPFIDNHKTPASMLLSETTKTYLRELFIKEIYKREKLISTKYTQKGIACESDNLDLIYQVTGVKYFKNQTLLSNDYITGTPDAWGEDHILDAKTSWDIFTFSAVDEKKARTDYFGQMLGYMILKEKKKARLAYALVNTPEEIISYELYLLKVKGLIKDESDEDEAKARLNFIFDDIPAEKRLKIFDFEYCEATHNKLLERIKISRQYMNSLSL